MSYLYFIILSDPRVIRIHYPCCEKPIADTKPVLLDPQHTYTVLYSDS